MDIRHLQIFLVVRSLRLLSAGDFHCPRLGLRFGEVCLDLPVDLGADLLLSLSLVFLNLEVRVRGKALVLQRLLVRDDVTLPRLELLQVPLTFFNLELREHFGGPQQHGLFLQQDLLYEF